MTEQTMTSAERRELAALARKRARVAKDNVDAFAALKLAEFEQNLAAEYEFSDAAWAQVTTTANEHVRKANRVVAQICAENGIPDEFQPSLSLHWSSRGRNSMAERRTELRALAKAKIDSSKKDAKAQIEAASVEIQTELLAAGLTTDAAQNFLSSMPSVESLLPPLSLEDIEKAREIESSQSTRSRYRYLAAVDGSDDK